jgi:hypothetical protein
VPPGTDYIQVAAGSYHSLAIRETETDVEIGMPIGSDNHPEDYVLLQNYPNPFNPTTTIKYELLRYGFVELKVYNLIGQEIQTLVSGYREANRYEVVWNAGDVPSGIYLYRLKVGSHVETRKLILQK